MRGAEPFDAEVFVLGTSMIRFAGVGRVGLPPVDG